MIGMAPEPIQPGESSHLFTELELNEMREYVLGVMHWMMVRDIYLINDQWHEMKLSTGQRANLNFVVIDGPTQAAYAHRVDINADGQHETDMDDFVRIY